MNVMTFPPHRHHLPRVLAAVVLGLLLLAVPSACALTFGSAIRITTNTGNSSTPSVAAIGGNVYVAWADDTPVPGSGTASEIWLRVSSNNGVSFGSAIRITTNTGDSAFPSVAASGSYVYVAWDDDTIVPGGGTCTINPGYPPTCPGEIWMRVSSNYGGSFGSAIRISYNAYNSVEPSVAAIGSNVYIAWADDTPVSGSGSSYEIWMRVSSNNGASFGSPIRITTNTGWSVKPSVAAVGNYVYVAWDDYTTVTGSGGSPEIWMRVSSDNGASLGSAIRITTNTGDSVSPSVAAIGSNVYVAWEDFTPVPGSGTAPEIWMRVSNNNGASFGSAIRISTNTGWSVNHSVAAVGSYVYIAWDDDTLVSGSGGYIPEIWMRVSSNNGASFGSAIRITTNTGYSMAPSVAAIGSNVYVAWMDDTLVAGSGGSYEIWLRVGS